MIEKLDVSGVHMNVGTDLNKYVVKKIGKLDKYLPRHARASVQVDVRLKESRAKDKKTSTCEVVMRLPHETIAVKESTVNMFAAVDIVEAKLKNQLRKYKDLHSTKRLHNKILARLRRQSA